MNGGDFSSLNVMAVEDESFSQTVLAKVLEEVGVASVTVSTSRRSFRAPPKRWRTVVRVSWKTGISTSRFTCTSTSLLATLRIMSS